jgi:8-oxo-dGTP pyrophosphatase MutT (NUDIX family)
MHRKVLLDLLAGYRRRYPEEAPVVERFVAFVAASPDCFKRSLMQGHVTGSAWLVNQRGSHVLLTHHRKLDLWIQLGGHADGHPNVLEVAWQEAREESGIDSIQPVATDVFDIDIHAIPARGDEPEHFHYDVRFVFRADDSENYTVSAESHDLEWVEITRLQEKTADETMLRMAGKWLKHHHSQ